MQAINESLGRVVAVLEDIADTKVVWKRGLVNRGGPHRRLRGQRSPVSIGEDECLAFGKVIERFRPGHCFIIGNAFGLSSAYIAQVMRDHGGESVTTLDNQSEGTGAQIAAVAQTLTDRLGLTDILKHRRGSSPQDIATTAEQPSYELIFVDGLHRHPQVTRDLHGVLPYCTETSIVVFHDGFIVGVPEAVHEARRLGFRCLWVPTSCEMIFATRDENVLEELKTLFPEGIEDRAHRSYLLGYLLHLRDVWSFRFSRLLGQD